MNKQELINSVACKTGKSKAEIKRILNVFLDTIGDTLAENEPVRILRFGTFTVQTVPGRMGRNPRTGEPLKIDKKKKIRFKAGAELTGKIN